MTLTQKLFNKKGYDIAIETSKGIWSDSLGISGKRRKFCVRIDYIGAAVPASEPVVCDLQEGPDDPYYVKSVSSPYDWPADDSSVCNPLRDDDDYLWTNYWTLFRLKDPAIYESGLKIVYTVPEKLTNIGTVMTLRVEEEIVFKKELIEAGTFEEIIDLSVVGERMAEYLDRAHIFQKLLLEEWIRFCDANEIKYWLICGGALGAYRDGEIIPWDDDIDVAVTRSMYERIVHMAPAEWTGENGFKLITPENLGDSVFMDQMTRLVYTSELLPNSLYDRVRGMTNADVEDHPVLDIYILEKGFDSKLLHKLQTSVLKALYGMEMAYRGCFNEEEYALTEKAGMVKVVKRLMRIGKKVPLKSLMSMHRKVSLLRMNSIGDYYFFSNGYIGCLDWRFDKKWFGFGRKAMLGDTEVVIPKDVEKYLEKQYGDFASLPPGWARRPGHYSVD